jgi:hypothetical protein
MTSMAAEVMRGFLSRLSDQRVNVHTSEASKDQLIHQDLYVNQRPSRAVASAAVSSGALQRAHPPGSQDQPGEER